LHAELQHVPSTQLPEPHCDPVVHAWPFGSEHVPTPFALHVCGAAHDAVEQHEPFTQLPLLHCVPPLHVAPRASLLVHVLVAVLHQSFVVSQSESLAHDVLHAPDAHA
jgi:hypothetical protein